MLLGLFTAKHCSDLTMLHIDNQDLFLQYHSANFVPASSGKMDQIGHLPPQIHIESHSNINHFPVGPFTVYRDF